MKGYVGRVGQVWEGLHGRTVCLIVESDRRLLCVEHFVFDLESGDKHVVREWRDDPWRDDGEWHLARRRIT